MVAYESVKTKEKSSWVIPKVVALVYGSARLLELFIAKFKSQFKLDWSLLELVAYESGRNESCDFICNI